MAFTPGDTPQASVSTDPELPKILEELREREPIFHSPAFGTSNADFAQAMAAEYWEIGASGWRYTRDFILNELYTQPPAFAADLGWLTSDHAVLRLGPETFLFTYKLQQVERVTRRATIWRRQGAQWQVLYHQGTIISPEAQGPAARS